MCIRLAAAPNIPRSPSPTAPIHQCMHLPTHAHAPPPLAQVFAMPIFDAAEAAVRRSMRSPPRPLLLRLVLRSAYVALVTLAACLLPFFGELM